MGRRVLHAPEVKIRAVELYREHGPAEAARRLAAEGTTVSQGTIRSWASRGDVATERAQGTEAAIAAAALSREDRRSKLADRLLEVAEMSVERCATEINKASLRDVVGLFTRAIHDHQLLTGSATSRTESGTVDTAHELIDELAARRSA